MRRSAAIALALSAVLAACGSDPPPLPVAKAAKVTREFREGERLGRLSFPRFHESVRVTAGFKQATIDRGPSWYPGSWLPGEGRTIYVAGHRRTHGGPFRHLGRVRRGDRVIFSTPHAVATYAVTRRGLIHERRTSILTSGSREELRLQTCTIPAGHKRLLVFARLVSIERR